jgi:hypothetical protein
MSSRGFEAGYNGTSAIELVGSGVAMNILLDITTKCNVDYKHVGERSLAIFGKVFREDSIIRYSCAGIIQIRFDGRR